MAAAVDAKQAATIADRAEASAFADLYAAAPREVQTRLGLRVMRVSDAVVMLAPGMPSPMFNRVIGLGMESDAAAPAVRTIVETFAAAGVQNWWLHWNPFARPPSLLAALQANGFAEASRRSWAKMLRDASPAQRVDTTLEVQPAGASQASDVAHAICVAFGMPSIMAQWLQALHGRPRWRIYAVHDGTRVVGGGCLFVDGKSAWFGMGAIIESHRRRGGQSALLARRVTDAVGLGCVHLVTETGEPIGDEANPSLANIRRCGFTTVASRLNLVGIARWPDGG